MSSILRRKGTPILLIALCIIVYLFYKLLLEETIRSTSSQTDLDIPVVMHDPQGDMPEKSRLYDTEVTCDTEDYKETDFQRQLENTETVLIPEVVVLEKLAREDLAALYHAYIENVQYFCKRILHLGNLQDGGWDVCHEDAYRPKPKCYVYSFGINNDFSFDDAIIEKYGCMVHSFDPSMHTQSYDRKTMNYFHNMGIASVNMQTHHGWPLKTIDTIVKELGHTTKEISILKMDIELWEWDVLPDVIESGVLDQVTTILVEFHLNLVAPAKESGRKTYLRALKLLKKIYDLGFRIFFTHRNPSLIFQANCKNVERSNCHEVSFVKVKRSDTNHSW